MYNMYSSLYMCTICTITYTAIGSLNTLDTARSRYPTSLAVHLLVPASWRTPSLDGEAPASAKPEMYTLPLVYTYNMYTRGHG